MQRITAAVKGRGIKVQHLAALFHHQPQHPGRSLILFVYLTRPDRPMQIRQIPL